MADKWEKFQIFDRHGTSFKLTEPRWQKYARLLKQYEGWASSLRAEYGHEVVTYLEESQVLDEQVESARRAREAPRQDRAGGRAARHRGPPRPARPTSAPGGGAQDRAGRDPPHPPAMFESHDYREFLRVHGS